MSWLSRLPGFARGVHPPPAKAAMLAAAIGDVAPPAELHLPLHQHAGAPAGLAVALRTDLARGDLVGEAVGALGARVHAPIDGRAVGLTAVSLPNGRRSPSLHLRGAADAAPLAFEQWAGGDWTVPPADALGPERIVAAVREAGVVGQGGAAFPTHVKLARDPARPVEVLIGNGCECEPMLAADARLMTQAPALVAAGLTLAARAVGAARVIVAIEADKEEAIAAMRRAASPEGSEPRTSPAGREPRTNPEGADSLASPAGSEPSSHDPTHRSSDPRIEVVVVQTRYPMGGERQLIPALLGREVPTGGLPADVGALVVNVGTAAAIAQAVLRDRPVTHRVVTVTGAVARPANLFAPIGAPFSALLARCGGAASDARRVIAGGPMMGFTVTDLDAPLTKGTSGIVVLDEAAVRAEQRTECIRCARCVDVCPLGLLPTRIALAARAGRADLMSRYDALACCECGCCAFVCPARIPLVQLIRSGKTTLRRERRRAEEVAS